MKNWEIIIENLRNAGWNCGFLSSTDPKRRQFWVATAERQDAGRFIVYADDMANAFLEPDAGFIVNLNSHELLGNHR